MPRALYTALLQELDGPVAGLYESDPVPAGYRWVVRDITAWHGGGGIGAVHGLRVEKHPDTIPFWSVSSLDAVTLRSYHWSGRQVLDAGDQIGINTDEDGWYVRITGYVLTLP